GRHTSRNPGGTPRVTCSKRQRGSTPTATAVASDRTRSHSSAGLLYRRELRGKILVRLERLLGQIGIELAKLRRVADITFVSHFGIFGLHLERCGRASSSWSSTTRRRACLVSPCRTTAR